MVPTTGMFHNHPMNLQAGLAHVQLQLPVLGPVGVCEAAGPILEVGADALHGGHENHRTAVHVGLG